MKVFRSGDTFRMNEWPHNDDYIPFGFVSGLNVVGYCYDEEHDYHSYLLFFDQNSKHIPDKLRWNLPTHNHLYLWNAEDNYWAVEANQRNEMMAFFHRQKARLYLPYYADWSHESRILQFIGDNDLWGRYDELMARWRES